MPREGDRLLLQGAVTVDTVHRVLEESAADLRDAVAVIDFRNVTEADSAAVVLAVQWLREARAAGRTVRFENLPDGMRKLARLYGVHELISGA